MLSRVLTASLNGMEAETVTVEVEVFPGLPGFEVVGLAGSSIREAPLRIRASLSTMGAKYPGQRILVNLVPAARRKEGTHFDLPIAMGILGATGQVGEEMDDCAYFGELSLEGNLVPVRGALPLVLHARKQGWKRAVIPYANRREVMDVEGIQICPCRSLAEVLEQGRNGWKKVPPDGMPKGDEEEHRKSPEEAEQEMGDYGEVYGQEQAKRALVIAAAGSHGLLMVGSPGCGKSMLAERFPGILPPLTKEETLEIARIYSVAGLLNEENPYIRSRPFRHPHHTVSKAALLGGGRFPRPGELSLAHNGVLYLDELGEFSGQLLDCLRQPLEEDTVTVARSDGVVTFPCKVTLLSASNPCRCGYLGDPYRRCTCTPAEIKRYENRLSGPFMDRLDMQLFLPRADWQAEAEKKGTDTKEMRRLVLLGRERQEKRFCHTSYHFNSQIPGSKIMEYVELNPPAKVLLKELAEKRILSMRGIHRALRVARTIGDIQGSEVVTEEHLMEAVGYRFRKEG